MEKLVVLDTESWNFTEIDHVRAARLAVALRSWLLTLDPELCAFRFLEEDLPIVEAVLSGDLPLPHKERQPHLSAVVEGTPPPEYLNLALPFYDTIRGVPLEPPRAVWKDGKRCAWVIFENSSEGWSELILEFVHNVSKKLRIQRGLEE